jgi:hypothetical protein
MRVRMRVLLVSLVADYSAAPDRRCRGDLPTRPRGILAGKVEAGGDERVSGSLQRTFQCASQQTWASCCSRTCSSIITTESSLAALAFFTIS